MQQRAWAHSTAKAMPRKPPLSRLTKLINATLARLTSGSTILATFTATIVGTGVYICYKDWNRYRRMMDQFSRGNIIEPMGSNQYQLHYFHRPLEVKRLQDVLRPEISNQYYLVYGEVGSGKTRLILEVIQELMEKQGKHKNGAPIYFLASQGNSFPDSFAQAINFHFDEHISFKFFLDFIFRVGELPKNDDQTKFERVLNALEKAAFQYLKRTGKPVVLVADGVDWIHETMLERLQEKAKLWADTNIIKVIFVSNCERTEEVLQSNHSAWSRAAPPINIGDLSHEQARKYLLYRDYLMERAAYSIRDSSRETTTGPDAKKYVPEMQMPPDIMEKILDLTGGRLQLLLVCKRSWLEGTPFEITAQNLKLKERAKFLAPLRQPSQRKVIETLYKAPGHEMLLRNLVDATSHEDIRKLALDNIIKIERDDVRGLVVTFQSRLTEVVVERLMTIYQLQSKKRAESSESPAKN